MACTGRAAVLDAAPSGTQKIILKIDLEDSWKSVRAWDSSADEKVAYEFENVKNMVLFVTHLYRDDKLRSMGLALHRHAATWLLGGAMWKMTWSLWMCPGRAASEGIWSRRRCKRS